MNLPARMLAAGAVVISAASSVGHAQQTPAGSTLAGEPYVWERLQVLHAFDLDGTRSSVVDTRVRVQSEAGVREAGAIAIPYRRDLGTLEFEYVRVRKPSGELIATPLASAIEVAADVTRAAPTYTDAYVKTINVQGLAIGDVVEWRARHRERSVIRGHFWYEQGWLDYQPVVEQEIRVAVPAAAAVTVRSRGLEPAVSVENGQRIYLWRRQAMMRPTDAELRRRLYDERDLRPAIQITSFRSWADVGDAVRTLWKDRAAVTPAIRAKAAELTSGAADEAARVRALYAFVATKIRYVSVSFGVGSLQPHAADEVLANGFGDCKDKHTLLAALLQAVGIPSEAALIGVGQGFDAETPSVAPFNHVITRLRLGAAPTWLDTTLELAPYGHLISHELDRPVLIVPPAGESTVSRTPADGGRPNEWRSTVEGTLDANGRLDATVTEIVSGDPEIVLRAMFRALPRAQWPQLLKGLSIGQTFGGTASDVAITPVEDTSGPFRLTYRYVNDALRAWPNHMFYAPMPSLALPVVPEAAEALTPIEMVPIRVASRTRVRLPDGYRATVPAGGVEAALEEAFGRFQWNAAIRAGVYESERDVAFTAREIPLAQFDAYGAFHKAINGFSGHVELAEVKPWAFGDYPLIEWYAGASSGSLQTLRSAVEAVDAGRSAQGLSLLQEVTRAEPKNTAAWLLLGWAQMRAGPTEDSLATLRRQAEATPTPFLYKQLAIALQDSGRDAEAADVWAKGRRLYPDDRDFPLYLGERLIELSRFAEAGEVLRPVVSREPRSARLQWNLAKAAIGLHQHDAGIAAIERAVELEASPFALNNYAWALADAGVALDRAVAYAERSVRETEAQLANVTLATLDDKALEATRSLAYNWDTLAWAKFKSGDRETARRYQAAAWDLGQRSLLAHHLGAIAESLNDRLAAVDAYTLAALSDPAFAAPREALKRLLPAGSDVDKTLSAAGALVVDRRTISFARLPGAEGTAEIFVLAGDSGVTDVKFVTGAAALRAQAEMLRSVKLPARMPSPSISVVRRGVLTCAPERASCQFRLLPSDSMTSIK